MANVGRKPKPTKIKQLHGSRQPVNKREPRPKVGARPPRVPSWLPEEGKREWRRVVKALHRLGLLTELDRAALEAYCVCYGRWVEAERVVAERGPVMKTSNGNLIQNPYLSIANRAMADMRRFLAEFGMTPSSRSRVAVQTPQEKSEFEKFMERRSK